MKAPINYITLDEYNAFKNSIFPEDYHDIKWRTYKEREAMEAELKEMYKRLMPVEGMGATEILFSDRRAKTIVKVLTPNKIVVMENETKCTDYYGDKYEILDTLADYMPAEVYTRRRSGRWVAEGQPDKMGSVFLRIGERHHSIDPSF